MKKIINYKLLLVLLFVASCGKVSTTKQYDVNVLELEAEEIDSMYNVSARKYVDVYFKLSDAYFSMKEYKKSYNAVKKGLRLDSQNILYQLRAAELEIIIKDYTASYQRVQYILSINNNEDVVDKCNKILKLILKEKIDVNKKVVSPMYTKKVIIIFFPDVKELYSKSIMERIEQEFKVEIIEMHTDEEENGKNERDGLDDYLITSINDIYKNNSKSVIDDFLSRYNLKGEELDKRENRIIFIKSAFLDSGKTEAEWDRFLQQFSIQYDANILLEQIKSLALSVNKDDVIGVLAITSRDIYSGENDNNYLFGLSKDNIAVMSLKRFETDQTINTVIIKRIVMQSLTSMGHIIGIPRCTTKACARAYADSLNEQDLKDDILCFECIKNINDVYSRW